jgi:hypothetical protein
LEREGLEGKRMERESLKVLFFVQPNPRTIFIPFLSATCSCIVELEKLYEAEMWGGGGSTPFRV